MLYSDIFGVIDQDKKEEPQTADDHPTFFECPKFSYPFLALRG